MKVHQHNNYATYKRVQALHVANHQRIIKRKGLTKESGEKLGWAKDSHLIDIHEGIVHHLDRELELIICHGVRNGYEAKFFMDRLGIDNVFSTDLSNVFMFDKRNFFPKDFDSVVELWIEKFDALYSNSVDHSRNPADTLRVWSNQLKTSGIMAVTFSCGPKVTDCDCFALSIDNYEAEIQELIDANGLPLTIVECNGPHYGKKHIGIAGTVDIFLRKV